MAQANHVYEDFEPTTEWVQDAGYDTLLIYLPGFKKEQLKVQVTSARGLRTFGERSLGDNKWSRFRKELPIPSNYDTNKISAKFEGGTLKIQHPKINIPETKQEDANPSLTKTKNDQLKQKGQDQLPQGVPHMIKSGTTNASNGNAAPQNIPEKEKHLADANANNADAKQCVPTKSLDDKRNEGLVDSRKMTAIGSKHEMSQDGGCKSKFVYYTQVIGGLITEIKPRKSTTLVMAAGLLVLVVGLYVNHVITSK